MEVYSGRIINRGECVTGVISCSCPLGTTNKEECLHIGETASLVWDDYCRVRDLIKSELQNKYLQVLSQEEKEVIKVCQAIIEDQDLNDEIYRDVNGGIPLMISLRRVYNRQYRIFQRQNAFFHSYMARDLICLRDEFIHRLKNSSPRYSLPRILLCEQIGLFDALYATERNIVAVVEEKHCAISHASILLAGKGIPCIAGIGVIKEWDGQFALLDGRTGELFINPEDSFVTKHIRSGVRQVAPENIKEFEERLGFQLLATVNTEREIAEAREGGFSGIGLVRTELLVDPTEISDYEAQLELYKRLTESFEGKRICIRTFDFGGDKYSLMPTYWQTMGLTAMHKGVRGTLLMNHEFKTQIRAIMAASLGTGISILFPYVSNKNEAQLILSIVKSVQDEFMQKNEMSVVIKVGFMIENIEAAQAIRELLPFADFINIGLNDLTRSVFLSDGIGDSGSDDYSLVPLKEVIGYIVTETHKDKKTVCICGESVLETLGIPFLKNIKIDAVSISPQSIYYLKGE